VLILTSNIGSHHIQAFAERDDLSPEDRRELTKRAVMEDVKKAFRPEFINRLDEMVVFDRLGRDEIGKIVEIQLGQFRARLEKRDLKLALTTGAKEYLAEVGWDPQYGARPLKRAIRKYLEDPMAKHVLAGEYPPGTTVEVDVDKTQTLTFKAKTLN
jgi:ATP-dependent Clp protease ATP-binding subunit ClpB